MNNLTTKASYVLAGSVLIAMLALLITNALTSKRISQSQQQFKSESLMEVLPVGPFDNNPLEKSHFVEATALSPHSPVEVFPIYKNGLPLAAALTLITPDGYNGSIKILLGVKVDGTIIASRVLHHKETPGLGDDIELRKSSWISSFSGISLARLPDSQWNVKKEGGLFDGFTGATITPRAVVKAIHRALVWYESNSKQVFKQT
ncbi:MAG: electron transport complex subunit RsxG [Granulosicoccus sp.]